MELTPEQIARAQKNLGDFRLVTNPATGAPQPTNIMPPPASSVPTPQSSQMTPSAPAVAPTTPPTPPTSPVAPPTVPTSTPTPTTAPQAPQKPLPQTVSVVDLLNAAGQSSDFASRQQLAQQYGIQGYTGTGPQNIELGKKFRELYEAKKAAPVPQGGAEARAAIQEAAVPKGEPTPVDPTKQFFDIYGGMNPIESQIYQQLSTLLSSTTTKQSLTDLYKQEFAAQGIQGLNLELADINRIMEGTEDDIRNEISNAGGFATESQIQALTGARNKTLLRKANYLTDVINAKNDYVENIVNLTKGDREQISKDLNDKLGITKTLLDMTQTMQKNAKENYQSIIDKIGWDGFAKTLGGNKEQIKRVEQIFGLAPGELDSIAAYKKPLTEKEQLEAEKLRLETKKLGQEIAQGPKAETQVIGEKGQEKLINSRTGEVIADYSGITGAGGIKQLALDNQKIADITGLLNNSSLDSAVGPSKAARTSFNMFTGAKSNFIAGIEQLREQLTLEKLIQAKQAGATFGALSDGERQTLAASATKLGTWALKDEAGNVYGYKANEEDFKAVLDKINNFAKLDFILKGGSPEAVNVTEMDDGTFWTNNSDGTYTQIK